MSRAVRTGLAVIGALAVAAAAGRVRRVRVEGDSMRPTLEPGDRLLVVRSRRPPQVGQLVAVPDPRDRSRLLVKRLAGRAGSMVDLRGDNPAASTDSRTFGLVPAGTVWGRVSRRYAPAERAGPVG